MTEIQDLLKEAKGVIKRWMEYAGSTHEMYCDGGTHSPKCLRQDAKEASEVFGRISRTLENQRNHQ